MEQNIALVGFMGSGKTATGKALARKLNLEFVDLDDLIEQREGRKIKDIFAESGEPHFRNLEKQITKEACLKTGQVIACGGGVVLDKDNVANLKKTGIMIYLKARPEVILERTKVYSHRPLLNVENPKKKIEQLLNSRQKFYEQADYIIDTSDLSVEEVVAKILTIIKKEK